MAKYSFDSTIGEILDDPVTNDMFFELVPEAKDYAEMLEMGRGFTINGAMDFIRTIADGLGIDNFDERVADFEAKLEAID